MTNLIVTIIAIALGAAVTASTLYYGGNGYMANVSKASAAQVVNYLTNYVQAMNVWAQRNGGFPNPNSNFPMTSSVGNYAFTKANIDSFLVPRYMQFNSPPSKLLTSNLFLYFDPSIPMQNGVIAGFLGPNDKSICGAIETMRTNAAPNYRTWNLNTLKTDNSKINPMFCGNFGCFINDGGWGSTSTYAYVVYFRVRSAPNTNYADADPKTCL